MLKRLLVVGVLFWSQAVAATAAGPPKVIDSPGPVEAAIFIHSVSVDRLLSYIQAGYGARPALPGWSDSLRRRLAADEAAMYITGIRDVGEEKTWCVTASNVPPDEVIATVVAELAGTRGEANGAAQVAAALARKFPCTKRLLRNTRIDRHASPALAQRAIAGPACGTRITCIVSQASSRTAEVNRSATRASG